MRANKKTHQRGTKKRKRILQCSSSSEEEPSSPLKNSKTFAKEPIFTVPLFDCKKIQEDEELRKLSIETSFSSKNQNNNEIVGSTSSSKCQESYVPSKEIGPNFSIMLDDNDFLPSEDILEDTSKLKGKTSLASEIKPKSTKVSDLSSKKLSFGAHSMNLDDKNKIKLVKKPTSYSSSDDDVFISPRKISSTKRILSNSTLASNATTSIIADKTTISTCDMSCSNKLSNKESMAIDAVKAKTAVITPFNYSPSSSQTIANNSKSLISQVYFFK